MNNLFDCNGFTMTDDPQFINFVDIHYYNSYIECLWKPEQTKPRVYYIYLAMTKLLLMRSEDVVYLQNSEYATPIQQGSINRSLEELYSFNRPV